MFLSNTKKKYTQKCGLRDRIGWRINRKYEHHGVDVNVGCQVK